MSRMSMLPPTRRGGTTECCPGSAGARPMVPQNGFRGTLPPAPYSAGANDCGSYFQIWSAGSLNWSASRPKPGMLAVQPQPEGVRPRIVTLIASPGSAPSTWTGPVTGFTLPKSSFARSASVDFAESWAPEESMVSNSTVSPGATASAGVLALFQPIWLSRLGMVWVQRDRKGTRL